jgi:hypothetical protein
MSTRNLCEGYMKFSETTPLIKRRLSFVVTEIHSMDGKYDQAISLILRVLSNYASVGFDAGSYAIKIKNLKISEEAKTLRIKLNDDKEWASLTINEHPMPLKNLWSEWKKIAAEITEEKIWDDLLMHPMITVTKDEDARLREVEKRGEYDPIHRYEAAKIKVAI